MTLSPDSEKNTREEKIETRNSLIKFQQLAGAKIGSFLRDFIGLPSAISRQHTGQEQWDSISELQAYPRTLEEGSQDSRQNFSEKEVEIPVKKCSKENLSATAFDTYNRRTKDHDLQSIYFNILSNLSESILQNSPPLINIISNMNSDKIDSMEKNVFFLNNEFNRLRNLRHNLFTFPYLINSTYSPFNSSIISHHIFNGFDLLHRPIFHDMVWTGLGYSMRPGWCTFNLPNELAEYGFKLENNSQIINKSFPQPDFTESSQEKPTFTLVPREREHNSYDEQFLNSNNTEFSAYNFFSKRSSLFTDSNGVSYEQLKSKSPFTQAKPIDFDSNDILENKVVTHLQNGLGKYELNYLTFGQKKIETKLYKELNGDPERVVSSFHSTTQYLDRDGKVYTSVKTCKIYGDGRNTTTTSLYREGRQFGELKDQDEKVENSELKSH